MTESDIKTSHIYTNDKGRFRRVVKMTKMGAWVDAHYDAVYVNTKGKMKRVATIRPGVPDRCSPIALASWATREETDAEAQAVRAVLDGVK